MSENEKTNKGGRPQKYPGEDPVRIGALIRPRYKEAIELIARDRSCTLGEAIGFCVAKTARNYFIDKEPILDFIRPKYEIMFYLYSACLFDFYDPKSPNESYHSINQYKTPYWSFCDQDEYIALIEKIRKTPERFRSKLEDYTLSILTADLYINDSFTKEFFTTETNATVGFMTMLNTTYGMYSRYFHVEKFLIAIEEAWKEGTTKEEFLVMVCALLNFNMYEHLNDLIIQVNLESLTNSLNRKLLQDEIEKFKEHKKLTTIQQDGSEITYYSEIPTYEEISAYIEKFIPFGDPHNKDIKVSLNPNLN